MTYGIYTPFGLGDFEFGRLGLVTSGQQPLLGLGQLPTWSKIHSWTTYINTVNEMVMEMEIVGIGFGRDGTDDSDLDLNDIILILPPDKTRKDATNFKAWLTLKNRKETGRIKEITAYACNEANESDRLAIERGIVLDRTTEAEYVTGTLYNGDRVWEGVTGRFIQLWDTNPEGARYVYGLNSIKEYDEESVDGERHFMLNPAEDTSKVLFLTGKSLYNPDFSFVPGPYLNPSNRLNFPEPNHTIWVTGATKLSDSQLKNISGYAGTLTLSSQDIYNVAQGFMLRFDFNNISFLKEFGPYYDIGKLLWEVYIPIKYKLNVTNVFDYKAMLVFYLPHQVKDVNTGAVILEPGWYPFYLPDETAKEGYYLDSLTYEEKIFRARVLDSAITDDGQFIIGIWASGMAEMGGTSEDGDKLLMEYCDDIMNEKYSVANSYPMMQTFKLDYDMYIDSVKVYARPSTELKQAGHITIAIRTSPSSSVLASGSVNMIDDGKFRWYEAELFDYNNPKHKKLFRANTTYYLSVNVASTEHADIGATSNIYPDGQLYRYSVYGDNPLTPYPNSDMLFKIYGLMEPYPGYGVVFDSSENYIYIEPNTNVKLSKEELPRVAFDIVFKSEKDTEQLIYISDIGVNKGTKIYVKDGKLYINVYHTDTAISNLTYNLSSIEIGKKYRFDIRITEVGVHGSIELYIDDIFITRSELLTSSDIAYSESPGYIGGRLKTVEEPYARCLKGYLCNFALMSGGDYVSFWKMREGTGQYLYDDYNTLTLGILSNSFEPTYWTQDVPWGRPCNLGMTIDYFSPWLKIYHKSAIVNRQVVATFTERAIYDYKNGAFVISKTPKEIKGVWLNNPDTNQKYGPNLLPYLTRGESSDFTLPIDNLYARVNLKKKWEWDVEGLDIILKRAVYPITVDNKEIPYAIDVGEHIRKTGFVWIEYTALKDDGVAIPEPRDVLGLPYYHWRYLYKNGTDSELFMLTYQTVTDDLGNLKEISPYIPWGMKVDVSYNKLPDGSVPIMRNRAIDGRIDQGICLHPDMNLNVLIEGDLVEGASGKGEIRGLGSKTP